MWAAHHGHVAALDVLIEKGANLEAADNQFGMTALMSAAAQNQTGAIKILLDNGAKINSRMKDRRTALMLTAMLGHADSVKMLLDRGAEVNARDSGQYTALSLAKSQQKSDVVEILEKAGGIEGKDTQDATAKTFTIK
jgi:ankyrin repeat protein